MRFRSARVEFRQSFLGSHGWLASTLPFLAATLAALAIVCAPACDAFAREKALSWKPIEDALLRVNDAPVKDWNVYRTGKKTDRLLVQIGSRFLLIEVHEHQIFEIDPAKVQQKPSELLWDPADRPAQPLGTSAWTASDEGAAFAISATLDSENRAISLQLPHPPDVGDLPAKAAGPVRQRNRY